MTSSNIFLIIIFFVYGLAFFAVGLAVALESRRSSALPLASSLNYLAAFGILHASVEWLDMFILVELYGGGKPDDLPIRPLRLLLLAVSVLCLLQFAVRLIIANAQKHRWLGWVPLVLFAGWLFSFFVPHVYWLPSGATVGAVSACLQCHSGASTTYLALSSEWVTSADIWARYLMYLPGSALAALAMLTQKPYFKAMGLDNLVRYANLAAIAFSLNAVFAGVIVPPGTFFPASVVNYASFFALTSVPPQVFRAASAVAIAYLIVQISSVFEIQQRRQLEKAQRERIEAQQRALESQRLAQEQLEQWNRELEARIQQRTREVEQRNRQVAILEERDRIAREMHDSLGQILGYLGLKLLDIDRMIANGRVEDARAALRQAADAVHDSCADVRESILSLKTSLSEEGGLIGTLKEYLAKFGDQASLKTEMIVDDRVGLQLAPLAEVQLLRIVQEALTNVRKHAKARRAVVKIEAVDGHTSVIVEDDGRGFDSERLAEQKGQHFGLQAMRERAEEIGAVFEVETGIGRGTRIIVRLPTEAGEPLDERSKAGGVTDARSNDNSPSC